MSSTEAETPKSLEEHPPPPKIQPLTTSGTTIDHEQGQSTFSPIQEMTPPGPSNQEECTDPTSVTEMKGTGFWTIEPYSYGKDLYTQGSKPRKNFKKTHSSKKEVNDNRLIEITPGIYEQNDYQKYLAVDFESSDIDIFDVHRDIVHCCGGKEPTIYSQSNGSHFNWWS